VLKHDTLLAMEAIHGAHSGANIEAAFWEVAQNAGVETKLGYFMLDNASSNTVMHTRQRDETDNDRDISRIVETLATLGEIFRTARHKFKIV
jgi:hypothetical protein